jgi:hypothetical protein
VSDKEAVELEELLALFKLGLGETEQFAAALQEEAAALEAANVYAMLENTPLVDGVITDLRRTQSILDDLDESLKVGVLLWVPKGVLVSNDTKVKPA